MMQRQRGKFQESLPSKLIVRGKDLERVKIGLEKSESKLTLTDGSRYLGDFIGDLEKQTKWIGEKVESWVEATDSLAEISQWVP